MKLIKAIIRPNKVDDVKEALAKVQIAGMTVTECAGTAGRKDTWRCIAAGNTK